MPEYLGINAYFYIEVNFFKVNVLWNRKNCFVTLFIFSVMIK